MPLVTIVIINYNHEKYLKRRIESIINQTFQDFDLIIIDDASVDNSINIITKYSNKIAQLIVNTHNSGSGYLQWTKAVELCKTKYLWIAESDDVAKPDFLKRTIEIMETDNSIAFIEANSDYISDDGEFLNNTTGLEKNKSQCLNIWSKDFVLSGKEFLSLGQNANNLVTNVSSVLFRHSEISKNIHIVEKFKICGDWMLYNKIAETNKVAYLSETLSQFRIHNQSTSYNRFSNISFFKECFQVLNYSYKHLKDTIVDEKNFYVIASKYIPLRYSKPLWSMKLLKNLLSINAPFTLKTLFYSHLRKLTGK